MEEITRPINSQDQVPPHQPAINRFVARYPNIWLGLMLLTLHGAAVWGVQDGWARTLTLTHFGFFLLWQPLWRGEIKLTASSVVVAAVAGAALLFWGSWWLVTLWLAALVGLIGGAAFGASARAQRAVSMIAVIYLLALLLIWVVPHLFPDYQETQALAWLVRYGLVLLPLALLFIPIGHPETGAHMVDFIYSLILFLLVMVLVLGSFALKMVNRGDYLFALAEALVVVAFVLLVLGWLWRPRAGFAGFGQLLSRYLLSVGLPFERWLQNLATLAELEPEADPFLRLAVKELAHLPWVQGGHWEAEEGSGEFGVPSKHHIEMNLHGLRLELYTRWELSPSFSLHVKLLAELLGFFYEAKRREQQQRQNAYVQAIHETGARLTHDVKNLLQSLTGLCAAAASSEPDQAQALQGLMQRQLPQITQRLQQTMEKLKAPQQPDLKMLAADVWWKNLSQRYATEPIRFMAEDQVQGEVPAELFDSVADNLLQNALRKRQWERNLEISAHFMGGEEAVLRVCDTGSTVMDHVAEKLFGGPVPSQGGLGIGLYQAAKQAQQLGYMLRLSNNETGMVCFELRSSSRQTSG